MKVNSFTCRQNAWENKKKAVLILLVENRKNFEILILFFIFLRFLSPSKIVNYPLEF